MSGERDLGRGNAHATSENLTPGQLATMWSPQEMCEDAAMIYRMRSPSRHIVVPTGERDLGRGNAHATSENLTPDQLATMWSPQERGEDSDKICSMPSPSPRERGI